MPQRTLTTVEAPEILIEADGDLQLTGGDLAEVFAEADGSLDVSTDPTTGQVRVSSGGDCTVRVPRRARVTVRRVGGDARPLKDLAGDLVIGNVGGDLVLRQTAGVQVGHVGGDVSAKKISGALKLSGAGGDVSVREVTGAFTSGWVGGDLYLRDVAGAAEGQAGGNVSLNMLFAPEQAYSFRAGGDLLCRVPAGASARLAVQCGGELSVDVPGAQVTSSSDQSIITLGAGQAVVNFQAGSDVFISDITTADAGVAESGDDFGFDDRLAEQIESQVTARMAEVERELNAQFDQLNLDLSGLGRMNATEIAARVRRATEAARRKSEAAQRKIEAAQRKAERSAERANRPRKGWGFTMMVPTPPRPPTPARPPQPPAAPADPVSDDERLTILRMLEQGKITAADAEKLLAALEGKPA